MAKTSGLGDNFYWDGYNLSGDINSLGTISSSVATLETTGIDKSAIERIPGQRDGNIQFVSYFNAASNQAHPILSDPASTDVIITYARGTTLGDPAACMVAKQTSYDPTRGDDGDLKVAVSAVANGYGLEWGRQLTGGVDNLTAASTGTASVDFGTGSTSFGLQAYLHVFAFTGTSATVKIQESSDDGAGDAWADVTGGGFSAASGITSQRIETARGQTVERYLRLAVTGTFSNLDFAVVVVRNRVSTVF